MRMANLGIVMVVLVLEVLRAVRMVVPICSNPIVELRASAIQLGRRAAFIFVRVRPRVEVKIIVQFRVGPSECDRAELGAE